jgi:hypothetical protein
MMRRTPQRTQDESLYGCYILLQSPYLHPTSSVSIQPLLYFQQLEEGVDIK